MLLSPSRHFGFETRLDGHKQCTRHLLNAKFILSIVSERVQNCKFDLPPIQSTVSPHDCNRPPKGKTNQFPTKFDHFLLEQTQIHDMTQPDTLKNIFCPKKTKKKSFLHSTTIRKCLSRIEFLSSRQSNLGSRQN